MRVLIADPAGSSRAEGRCLDYPLFVRGGVVPRTTSKQKDLRSRADEFSKLTDEAKTSSWGPGA